MKAIILTVLLTITFNSFSQTAADSCGTYLGINMVGSRYFQNLDNADVNHEFQLNMEVGVTALFCFRNRSLLKTGVGYTFFRGVDPQEHKAISEYITLPVLIPFGDYGLKNGDKIKVLLGPQYSVLTRYGEMAPLDNSYDYSSSTFGMVSKIGLVGEVAYSRSKARLLNMFGLRASFDLSDFTFKHTSKMVNVQSNSSIGVFINMNKRM